MLTPLTLVFSICSSRYCSSFVSLFFSIFWAVVVFLRNFDFFILFFDIFPLLRSTKAVTTENMSSNKCKTWPVEFSENWMKIDKNLVTTKRGSCDHFLANLKIPNPVACGGWPNPKFFSDRFAYMERRKRSSYVKTRPVLRKHSELEDKTGTIISNSIFK